MILNAQGKPLARTTRHRLSDAEVADVRANEFESKVEIVVRHRRLPYLSRALADIVGCPRRPDFALMAIVHYVPEDAKTVAAIEGVRKNMAQERWDAYERWITFVPDAPMPTGVPEEPTTADAVMALVSGEAL